MSAFAMVLARSSSGWSGAEADLADCESMLELTDLLRDVDAQVRLLLIEQDDEYAALVRLDDGEDGPRAFLTDGRAADRYPLAEILAEDLEEIGGDELADEPLATGAHDSAPFGDPEVVDDLGTPAAALLELCEHRGTLPLDLLVAVCENAGCGAVFEDLRG